MNNMRNINNYLRKSVFFALQIEKPHSNLPKPINTYDIPIGMRNRYWNGWNVFGMMIFNNKVVGLWEAVMSALCWAIKSTATIGLLLARIAPVAFSLVLNGNIPMKCPNGRF